MHCQLAFIVVQCKISWLCLAFIDFIQLKILLPINRLDIGSTAKRPLFGGCPRWKGYLLMLMGPPSNHLHLHVRFQDENISIAFRGTAFNATGIRAEGVNRGFPLGPGLGSCVVSQRCSVVGSPQAFEPPPDDTVFVG